MRILSLRSSPALGAVLLAAALAVPADAGRTNSITNSAVPTNPLSFTSGYEHYVDWSDTSTLAGHLNYSTMDKFGTQAKYLDFTSFAFTGAPSRCFHVATHPVPNIHADTEIRVKDNLGVWLKLSDDPPLFASFAHAYIYFLPGGNTRSNPKIRVNAYHSGRNQDAFRLESTFFIENNMAACLDGIAALPGSVNQAAATVDANGNVIIHRAL